MGNNEVYAWVCSRCKTVCGCSRYGFLAKCYVLCHLYGSECNFLSHPEERVIKIISLCEHCERKIRKRRVFDALSESQLS